jgi:hypothetical protein
VPSSPGRVCAAVVLACVCFANPVLAQFDTGQISGFVRDSSGAVIPGATVTATNEGNGQQRVVISNSDGYYVFPSLLVGAYKISAELSGFNRFITTGVRLSAAARISVDMTLSVGTLTDTVEVKAAAILTESPVLGRTVGEQQIQQLPLSGRNPVFVARLQAGWWAGRWAVLAAPASAPGFSRSAAVAPMTCWSPLTEPLRTAPVRPRTPCWALSTSTPCRKSRS